MGRPEELAQIEKRDVDVKTMTVKIRGSKAKSSLRDVPLTDFCLRAFRGLPPTIDTPFLFPNDGWVGAKPRPGKRAAGKVNHDTWSDEVFGPALEGPA